MCYVVVYGYYLIGRFISLLSLYSIPCIDGIMYIPILFLYMLDDGIDSMIQYMVFI